MVVIPFPARAHVSTPHSPVLADLIEPYRRYLVGESRRDEGIERYIWGLRRFLDWMGDGATVADVGGKSIQEYKEYLANERAAAPATIINALAIQRDFARFCVIKGYRTDDPTVGVARPSKQRPRPKPLYPYEIEDLTRAMQLPPDLCADKRWYWERNRRVVYLLLYSGLRLSEAAGLRWEHIKLPANVIIVPAHLAKNSKERVVKLHRVLKALFEAVPECERHGAVAGRTDGQCLKSRSMGKIFKWWVADELCIADVHAHRLRHSFACLMLWNGADLKTIQELLGHAQLGTTEWYVTAREEDKQRAIDCIPDFGV